MDYLLKSSAVLFIFYVCYLLFLQRDTFFQANRWFLLSGLVLASSIPFIIIPNYIEYVPITSVVEYAYTNESTTGTASVIQEEPFNYIALMTWIYAAGILFFFGKLAIEFLSLKKILNRSSATSKGAFKLLETNETVAPFSFFNRIVYNPNQFKDDELAHVINHEKVHTKEWHSVDTLIAQFSCILFWFNPIVWLYKKALQQNLEFIADRKAQYISECDKSYQTVLLKASVKNHQLAFTNNFYTSLIKKRIVMLHKSKSNKLNQLKFVLVVPLLTLFMMSFNTKDIYIAIPSEGTFSLEIPTEDNNSFVTPPIQTGDIEIMITKDTTDDELKAFQKTLEDKGITFKYNNVKRNSKGEITRIKTDFKSKDHSSNYHINGDNGIEAFRFKSSDNSFSVGTVKKHKNTYTFETKDGRTQLQGTGANVYVFESDENEENDGQNIRIRTSNTNERDTIYITNGKSTWISKNGSETKIKASGSSNTNIFIEESDDPLFIIDGKAVKKSLFEDIDSDDIKSINVLKGNAALTTYGEKGKNGVLVITKKGSKNTFVSPKRITVTSDYIDTNSNQPLYIIDGKAIKEGEFRDLNPNSIESIEVIKDKKGTEVYGVRGKNGVILVNTKRLKQSQIVSGDIIEVEVEDNPWDVKTEVSSVYFTDDHNKSTAEFIISKHSTDAFINKQKKALKELGINAKINKIRRNKAGEITGIKISLDDNQGRKSSASWKEKEQAIPDIVLGKSGHKLFVRAIGN